MYSSTPVKKNTVFWQMECTNVSIIFISKLLSLQNYLMPMDCNITPRCSLIYRMYVLYLHNINASVCRNGLLREWRKKLLCIGEELTENRVHIPFVGLAPTSPLSSARASLGRGRREREVYKVGGNCGCVSWWMGAVWKPVPTKGPWAWFILSNHPYTGAPFYIQCDTEL